MDGTPRVNSAPLDDLLVLFGHFGEIFSPPLKSIGERISEMDRVDETPSKGEPNQHLHAMAGLCDELLSLTREFAEYAAIAQGLSSEPTPIRLSSLVAEIDRRYASRASSRELGWSCELVGNDATIHLDTIRFRQIVSHVLGFALNATAPGAKLRFEAESEPSGWKCRFSGIGAGSPDESIERAFAPLRRIAAQKADDGSDPSCLAICRDLVEKLGGTLEFHGSPDQERGITISLPLATA